MWSFKPTEARSWQYVLLLIMLQLSKLLLQSKLDSTFLTSGPWKQTKHTSDRSRAEHYTNEEERGEG